MIGQMSVLLRTNLPGTVYRGKVRDTFDLGDQMLIVATDRISAFDVVLPSGIPDKGRVLTQLSAFWFRRMAGLLPNHFLEVVDRRTPSPWPEARAEDWGALAGRAMLVRKAKRIDIECVVRGYLAGSAWQEYRERGTVCGQPIAAGLCESEVLPEPIFTPATKAATGHDENISIGEMEELVGKAITAELVEKSLLIYQTAAAYARERGIIIADTKMEFGLWEGGVLLIDELLTPDSSRFWPADGYAPGGPQPSFDKQYVRDWLTASGWNREPPAPELPAEVVEKTAEKYREAYRLLTGEELPGA